jgi:signal transduction histidine kinase/AmiR/NasT family two-component response regulator/Tfp pilus assembly protein PilF
MRVTAILLLLCFSISTSAQKQGQRLIDVRLRKLRSFKEDTNKVIALSELSESLASVNTDDGLKYGNEGLALALKLAWPKGAAANNNSLGTNYMSMANYEQAMVFFNKSLKVNEQLNLQEGIAVNLGNIGNIYVLQGNNVKALKNFRAALNLHEQLQDKAGIATDLVSIGNVYQNQSNYALAYEYLLKALKMHEELGNKAGIANTLSIIGVIYIKQKNFPLALENYEKALKIYQDLGDKSGIAKNLKNVGNVYISVKDYTGALENYNKALKIHEELGDKSGIARNLGNMGNVYQEQKNYPKALEYLLEASKMNEALGERYPMANNLGSIGCVYLEIARDTTGTIEASALIPGVLVGQRVDKAGNLRNAVSFLERAVNVDIEIGNLHELQNFSYFLSEAYELLGDYKSAYLTFTQATNANDSIFSLENNIKIAQLEEKRAEEVAQKLMEMRQLKIAAAKHERRYYITGLGILVLLTTGLARRFRTARKTRMQLEEKNRIIEAEKVNADQLRVRAERSEQFKHQFLTNMSHEIRTPMNAVSGMTDLLLDKNPRPDQLHYLNVISKSSDILLHIINDILDLSKIESGKMELETIDFSLSDTIRQVKETLSFRAEEKGLLLVCDIDTNIPPVLIGDPFRLNQVLINLGGNAIKFTEKGNVALSAKLVKMEGDMASVLIAVSDTGIGIPEDKLGHLFESFKQVQSSDSRIYGGSGLGLSISKELVEMQGGSISIDTAVGEGSRFSFTLTFPVGSAEALEKRTRAEQKADGHMLNGLRILLVDDNEYNRMVASETLFSKADVVIDEALNGQEAIDMVAQNNYDVVLMDIQMPVMNGLDATRYIRNKLPPPKNAIPIIALTASLLRGDADQCTNAGMNTYLPKPFKTWQLIAALAELTHKKERKDEDQIADKNKEE